jgi:hypothetical protein
MPPLALPARKPPNARGIEIEFRAAEQSDVMSMDFARRGDPVQWEGSFAEIDAATMISSACAICTTMV